MQAILWPIVSWLLREVVLKFVVVGVVFEVVTLLVPYVVGYLAPWVSTSALNGAFSALPGGVWWGLDLLAAGYGIPLVISAFIARFLIRRIPFIG